MKFNPSKDQVKGIATVALAAAAAFGSCVAPEQAANIFGAVAGVVVLVWIWG